ncbi:MAG: polysaccharide deacetylase family protein [Saprospiraceae bacterium]
MASFDQQMRYFKANFDIISTETALEYQKSGIIPKRPTISISFDDGYLNNMTNALPILEKYEIGATFFISSVCCRPANEHIFWSDVVAFSRNFSSDNYVVIDRKKFFKKDKYDLVEANFGISAYDYLKHQPVKERDRMIHDLKESYQIMEKLELLPEEYWKLMSFHQLKKFSKNPFVTIGSHGHRHFNLAEISLENARFELEHSKKQLEKTIEKEVKLFAFPDGSYNEEVLKIAREVGYNGLVGVNPRTASKNEDLIFRYGVSATTTPSSNLFFINKAFMERSRV